MKSKVLSGVLVLFLVYGVTGCDQGPSKARQKSMVKQNLLSMGQTLQMYKMDWEGEYPPHLGNLYPHLPAEAFVCPGSGTQPPESSSDFKEGRCDFGYIRKAPSEYDEDDPIVFSKPGAIDGGTVLVLYGDLSHTGTYEEPPEEVKKCLDETSN